MPIKICVAGVTGWAGSAVTRHILRSYDFHLAGVIARQGAGQEHWCGAGRAGGRHPDHGVPGGSAPGAARHADRLHQARLAQSAHPSVRLPSYVIAFETIFGLPDERLTIRHDAGTGAEPYVGGTLLAAQRVMGITGLVRGLDRLLFDS